MNDYFRVHPIGVVKKRNGEIRLEIKPEYHDALLGLEGFSHINV
ncbi:MAG: SAM-dependent methyltransferase, partial [Desulfobacterales bacterium]|nr:SAM-dependent methyltransferase [Desulfobacterales bacterium]